MKQLIAIVLAALAMPVLADQQQQQNIGRCGFISSDTGRAFCYGKAYRNMGWCSTIQNDTQRYTCEAQAVRDPRRCNFINDDDARNMCKSQASE